MPKTVYSSELIKIDDELNIEFDSPYRDIEVSISLRFKITRNGYLTDSDIPVIIGICKFDVLKAVGEAIEKKVDELK